VDLLSGDNRYRCQNCKKLSNAHKRFLFHRLPLVLTIQLKRFTNSLSKINKFVRYDTMMNLAKYCDGQQKQTIYELFGVVVHEGSSAWSGHYYSFVQTSDLNWYKVDNKFT
jgi:ubiquitin carboxyl-terminal hydrolase 36/42